MWLFNWILSTLLHQMESVHSSESSLLEKDTENRERKQR